MRLNTKSGWRSAAPNMDLRRRVDASFVAAECQRLERLWNPRRLLDARKTGPAQSVVAVAGNAQCLLRVLGVIGKQRCDRSQSGSCVGLWPSRLQAFPCVPGFGVGVAFARTDIVRLGSERARRDRQRRRRLARIHEQARKALERGTTFASI